MDLNKSIQSAVEHYKASNWEQAQNVCKEILKNDPTISGILYLQGIIYYQLGDYDSSIGCLKKVTELNPSHADAYYNLANAFRKKTQFDDSISCYKKALDLNPALYEAYYNLGIVHLDQKHLAEAIAYFQKAVQLNPVLPDSFYSLGVAFQEKGDIDEAITCYRKAIQLAPNDAEAYDNLGTALHEKGCFDEAIAHYQKAVQVDPHLIEAYNNLGIVLMEQGRHAESLAALDCALKLHPTFIKARWARCMSQLQIIYPDESSIYASRKSYRDELIGLRNSISLATATDRGDAADAVGTLQPFYLAYQGLNDRELQHLYGDLVCRIMSARYPEFADCPPLPSSSPTEPLRIGFASKFFSRHSIWQLCKGWVEMLNKRSFKLYGYRTGIEKDGNIPGREHFTRFAENIYGFEELCRIIRDDRLHILVYPEIGMDPVTLRMAALRLAPVQCASWLHPETPGLPTIDYFLSSDLMEPPDADDHYNEKLVRLPNLAIYYTPKDIAPLPMNRETFGLHDKSFVYLCSQSLFKYLPQYDAVFPRIAREVQNCRFIFISNQSKTVTEQFHRRISKAFAELGLSADDHVVFLPRLSPQEFYSLNSLVDVYLDNIGWSGGITTFEAIAFNLPVVTFSGSLMRGRHSTAILHMMGVTDTVVSSIDDYVAAAVRLGQDPEYRRQLSQKIGHNKGSVYRDKTCITALDDFFRTSARRRL
jgi:protein O-GlcNAc transferase